MFGDIMIMVSYTILALSALIARAETPRTFVRIAVTQRNFRRDPRRIL